MKQGKTLIELCKELERQRMARKDFIADTRSLMITTNEHGQSQLDVDLGNTNQIFNVNDLTHQQIASRLQIPLKYYQKMRLEYPSLLDENINSWFSKNGERRMLRTLDTNIRAFLSDRYRRLDNLELAEAVLPIIKEMKGAEIVSADITDTHMYIKVINKKLKAEVDVNDIVQAGIVISNSEVGLGSLKVEPLIYRLVCKNGLIVKDYAQKRYHVGKQVESEESAYEIYRDETLEADDKAFFMKVQDTVRCAVDEAKFMLSVDKLRQTKQQSTGDDPIKTVELLADKYVLNQNERGGILRHFIMAGDNSKFGLINAITRSSQDIEDYNRATELERLGGELLALPIKNQLVASAYPRTSNDINPSMKNVTPIQNKNVISIAR
ncbi:DUF932 domain-containing protein [Anaerosinus gibii]|uniref:DUF932 domain-containing protein n=1 Tax=Selenobaculum gibii TaxID=3054208 RepID=A0A9Y2AGX5_9FIRM|nr:DUF932 domain-containing protein [Selenobaculum gbiensis]WIW69869.1 DUF932 domain-containing protein [Selenobaculum gbiensis]